MSPKAPLTHHAGRSLVFQQRVNCRGIEDTPAVAPVWRTHPPDRDMPSCQPALVRSITWLFNRDLRIDQALLSRRLGLDLREVIVQLANFGQIGEWQRSLGARN